MPRGLPLKWEVSFLLIQAEAASRLGLIQALGAHRTMSDNPYSTAIVRYAAILLYTTGALLCGYLIIRAIWSGRTAGLIRASRMIGESYTAAESPSQFWFVVFLYAVAATVFAFLGWRSYRG